MTISRYVVEQADGTEMGTYAEDEYREAEGIAASIHGRVVEYEFEFSDSHVVKDYTEARR